MCAVSTNKGDFTGKKLLVLGANKESIPLIKRAREMGIYTIATDHLKNSPAKIEADKAFDIDGRDVKSLKYMAEKERIDGIILGAADPLVPSYVELCDLMNMPCYVKKDNLNFFTDKKVFKDVLNSVDIPTLPSLFYGNFLDKPVSWVYPVIVKPAVSRGGANVFLCNNFMETHKALPLAAQSSDNGKALVEPYTDMEDVSIYYIVCDGKPIFLSMADHKILRRKENISPVTYGNLFPSKRTSIFLKDYHNRIVRLCNKLNIHDGIFTMQAFVDEQTFYPYDPSAIISGIISNNVCKRTHGFDALGALIKYAFTGSMGNVFEPQLSDEIPFMEEIWILLCPGKIAKIEGLVELNNESHVLYCMDRLHEGDVVPEKFYQTEKSALARIWIAADKAENLERLSSKIRSEIRAYDENGKDMIYSI